MSVRIEAREGRGRRRGGRKVIRTEARLERFLDLIDGINAIFWEMDLPAWRLTFVSPQAERILGYPPKQWLREEGFWAGIVHPDDRDHAMRGYVEAAQGRHGGHVEYRARAADGHIVWLSDCIRVVADQAGRPHRLQGVMLDVTARHVANERAERLAAETGMREAAERALRLRDEVLGVVAHDLRNPVHTIAMSASALAELPLSDDERRRYLRIILRAAHTMDRLIGDLLDAYRKETGTFSIRRDRVALGPLVGELAETFEPLARERGVALRRDGPNRLPAVMGDRDRLVQAFSNLLTNAVKFTPAGGRIVLRVERVPHEVRVCVENTGDGIPAHDLPHVFDRFWQARHASAGGSGLGLYIAKAVAEAHGGRIWVESREGVGCRFFIALPTVEKGRPRAPGDTSRTRRA